MVMEFEKLYREEDGIRKVGVIVSAGYGQAWHETFRHYDQTELGVMDRQLVQAVLDDDEKAFIRRANELLAPLEKANSEKYDFEYQDPEAYVFRWSDMTVQWIPAGAEFQIREYDGSEWIVLKSDLRFMTA